MKLNLSAEQEASLRAFLARSEDAEKLTEREYVLDLYDIEPPVTLDMVFVKGGIAIDGAAVLHYDAEMDGWYMGERLETPDQVFDALTRAGAIGV